MRARAHGSSRAVMGLRMLAAGLLPLLCACAPGLAHKQQTPAPAGAYVAFEESGKSWWRLYFTLAWDQNEEPDWHLDALLADQVMAPVIAQTEPRISLWRFHRRAAPDEAGHRFSFIFYSDGETAGVVNNGVRASPVVARLLDAGVIVALEPAALYGAPAEDIGATSDQQWPPEVKRGWPWFVMGVSQSWLRLIAEVKTSRPQSETVSLDALLAYYRDINDEVSTLWRENGQHAYLHHLNAVFGYQLLIIRETNLKRF